MTTLCVAALLLMASPPESAPPDGLALVLTEQRQRIEVIKQITPAVACLFAKESTAGGGSGVLIDQEGYGLTNFHVVAGMLPGRAGDAGLPDHRKYDLEVLGLDPHGDVAMFRVVAPGPLPFANVGDSDALQVGDNCMALGNPFLLADDFTPSVTFGIVSGLHRYQWGTGRALSYTDCIQVDTSINPGNSGGPLFDMAGRLVGINGRISIEERSRVNVGVGYAITINQIKRFIPALRAGLVTPHAAAGFTVVDTSRKVIVNQILEDSASYKAGLRLSDRIVRLGGVEIRSANHFLSQLGTYPAHWPVELVFEREAKLVRPRFRLDELPLPEPRRGRLPPGAKPPDPFAPSAATQAANRRAVGRAIKMYGEAIGGAQALGSLKTIRFQGARRIAGQEKPEPLEWTEQRATAGAKLAAQADIERAVRWQLIDDAGHKRGDNGKVLRSDEVRGHVAAVIECQLPLQDTEKKKEAITCRAFLDDARGRLLAVEFKDPATSKAIRYEYDDDRRCGPLKLPHKRWQYTDDVLIAEDEFEKVEVTGE